MGVQNGSLLYFAYYIYKTYNLDVDASVDKTRVHPYKEWTTTAQAIGGPNAAYLAFWVVNYIIGNKGNFIHRLLVAFTKLYLVQPFVMFGMTLYASSSYGSSYDVALGTDWAMTV